MQSPPEEELPTPLSVTGVRVPDMETPQVVLEEPSTMWEWGSLLDFNVDDQLNITWSPEYQTIDPSSTQSNEETLTESMSQGGSDRIRKRDPRLTCENFLAGIVPCACPELDEKMEEEGMTGKKRARTASMVIVRCQVPGCEVDISELKGYHRRHRVCLSCANASAVVLEGQTKRYCQQCGKFHILPDFDEGKRSCRRKLERHNKRRRRKPTDFKGEAEKESSGDIPTQELDSEARKDNSSNHKVDEALLESEDGHVSPLSSVPSSQDIRSDALTSLATSREAHKEQGKESSISALSSSFGDNKSAYSSMCPTGRISFKLYDWNPAEFPRRLRHQIFQWLSNMPVELEGYIRPGCTILTVFIAMPRFMWEKLSEDAASYVHEFVSSPEYMLFGRGALIVYLNDTIFRFLKGGALLENVNRDMKAPRLHYVHPICFEAGKPMEFVACGSNLLQPKFRFLVSFAGKYLAYDHCLAISHGKTESHSDNEVNRDQSCDHQVYKIYIPTTESEIFGPAFIEVENEAGLSNFIPVLFGDQQTCSEMLMLEQRFDKSLYSTGPQLTDLNTVSESCKVFVPRQTSISELLVDIAWLIKEPQLEERVFSSAEIRRLNCLLGFLIENESTVILEKILWCLDILMNAEKLFTPVNKTNDADMSLFQNYLCLASELVRQRFRHTGKLIQHPDSSFLKHDSFSQDSTENDTLYEVSSDSQDLEMAMKKKLGSVPTSDFPQRSETVPLINKDVVMNVNHQQTNLMNIPKKSCRRIISSTMKSTRPLVLIVAVAALCSGVCAVVFHPHKVGELADSLRRCLFGISNP